MWLNYKVFSQTHWLGTSLILWTGLNVLVFTVLTEMFGSREKVDKSFLGVKT